MYTHIVHHNDHRSAGISLPQLFQLLFEDCFFIYCSYIFSIMKKLYTIYNICINLH